MIFSYHLPWSGLHKEHKSVEAYYKHVSQRQNQQEHRGFLSARKEWIRQHNQAGPDRKRLLSKKELVESKKTLDLVKKTGGKFVAPKKQFVQPDAWDPKLHGGEYDPSKEVTEKLWGKEVKGVWIQKGPKGVWDFEEYQDAAVEETENLHDSATAPFSEEGLARKKKAILDQFVQGSQARDRVAVESTGSELSLQALLDTIQSGNLSLPAPASSSAEGAAAGQGLAAADSSDSGEAGSASSDDEEGEEENVFGPCRKKLAATPAKPAAPKEKTARKGVKRPQALVSAVSTKLSGGSKQSSGSGGKPKPPERQESQESTLLADGRAQRALSNLQEKVSELEGKLAAVKLDDSIPDPDVASQSAFKQRCAERASELKTIGRQAREYNKRMEKSSNRDFFESGLTALQKIENACLAAHLLLTTVSAPSSSSPEKLVKAFEDTTEHIDLLSVDPLGTCFQLKYALAKASQSCLYSQYDNFCNQFLLDCQDMSNLQSSIGKSRLEEYVVSEIESRVLLNLRAIQKSDVQALAASKEEVPNLQDAVHICKAVCDASQAHGDYFLGSSLRGACQLALGLVSPSDLEATSQAIQDIARDDHADSSGGVHQFFKKHTVGQSLVDVATGRVASGETEAKATESLKRLGNDLEELKKYPLLAQSKV